MNLNIYSTKVARRVTRHAIRGVDYAVSEWGDPANPTMFYLHGWADCSATYQFVVDCLQRDWYVVAPDFRGFGMSKTETTAYWFPDYLADLDALLHIYAPHEAVRLVGHSMGGNIASLYAGTMPERVRALVNVEGFGLRDAKASDAPLRYRQWIEAGRQAPGFSTYTSFSELAQRLRQRNPRMGLGEAEFVARCWAEELDGQVRLRVDPLHKLPNAVLYRRSESEACWQNVTAHVLLVAGRDSELAGALGSEAALGLMQDAYSSAATVTAATITDAGHMMHFEAPAALTEQIDGFLRPTL